MFCCFLHHLQGDHCITCSKTTCFLQCCYTSYAIKCTIVMYVCTYVVITEYCVIYLTVVQTVCTYNDFKKFLYRQTTFQHVSMVDSTIIRAVPPAQTKTLLLQTFYHIMHTQIHSVFPSAQTHSTPEAVRHHGNPGSRSWHMHNS